MGGVALPHLTNLDMSHNSLHGELPMFFYSKKNMAALKENRIGPSLELVDLSHNKLKGKLNNLVELTQLCK